MSEKRFLQWRERAQAGVAAILGLLIEQKGQLRKKIAQNSKTVVYL